MPDVRSGPGLLNTPAQREHGNCGLLIINADDWGGWRSATDAAVACFKKGRITSVSAMVHMEDSARAAAIARTLGIDAGLHLNLNEEFTSAKCPSRLAAFQQRTRLFLRSNKYAQVCYHPFLREQFRYVYEAQVEEFCRLYGKFPSHVNGHQHMHLCANMLWARILPARQKVRGTFSFWPGEKSRINRLYRKMVSRHLERRYITTEYMFALSQCLNDRIARVKQLAQTSTVELMTHPEKGPELAWLQSDRFETWLGNLRRGTFTMLAAQ